MMIFTPSSHTVGASAHLKSTLGRLGLLILMAMTAACAGATAERNAGLDGAHPEKTDAEPNDDAAQSEEAEQARKRAAEAKRDELAEALAVVGSPKALAERADEAKVKLEAIIDKDPKNILALYNLGLIAWRHNDKAGAKAAWKRALSVRADYLPAQARLAQLQLVQGDKDGAVKTLNRIIDKEAGGDPYQPEARNILAEIAISERRWEDARRHARNVLLGDADNMNAYLNLALTYFRHRLVDTALLIADTALKRRPDAAALHNLMGLIYLRKDNSRLAMGSFSKALKANPTLVDAKLNLAALELSYGDFQSALARFDSVLAEKPDDPEIVMSRAVALRGLERYDEAADGYKQALVLDATFVQAQYNLCVLHHQFTNDWTAALENCKAYAATLPTRGKKRRELNRRIRSIKATIEALGPDEDEESVVPEDGAVDPEDGGAPTDQEPAKQTPESDEKAPQEGEPKEPGTERLPEKPEGSADDVDPAEPS
jgi:tetratricopeptide (TPR) repeat protein